jgi:hypothetical protein
LKNDDIKMSDSNTKAQPKLSLIKKGKFYFIYEDASFWILEDKTKRGLEIKEKTKDRVKNVVVDKGIIYDMDGKGNKVNIRSYYSKKDFEFQNVEKDALAMEKRYLELREITCPSD